MGRLNRLLRKAVNWKYQNRLKNRYFSLLSSNCNGVFILHDLGLRFNSPTVNLWITPHDFVRFLQKPQYYLEQSITFVDEPGVRHPVGRLDDIKIWFTHYSSQEQALEKWNERAARLDYENLFILMSDRDGCTYQDLADFDALPYKNKIVFTHVPYPEFRSAYYLKGWEREECVGECYQFVNGYSGKKHYDAFDYVAWFNGELD